jgi:hypothetical protein
MTHVKYSVRMDPACLFATLVSVSVYIESSHERSAPPIVFAHPHEFRIDNDLPFQLTADPINCMHDFQHVLVRKQVYQVQVRVITTYEVLLRRLSPER